MLETRSKHRLRRDSVVARGTWVIDLGRRQMMERERVQELGDRVWNRLFRGGLFGVLLGLVAVSSMFAIWRGCHGVGRLPWFKTRSNWKLGIRASADFLVCVSAIVWFRIYAWFRTCCC